MSAALDAQLLEIAGNQEGNFASPRQFAERLAAPEWKVKEELDRLLIMLKIDKVELITPTRTIPYYGLHRGVRAGQAQIDRITRERFQK